MSHLIIPENMMTSSNGNIFRVTGPLCGEFTGPGEFPAQRPVTRSFDVFFDLRPNKPLSKQPWGWWFETPSWSLWRQCNETVLIDMEYTSTHKHIEGVFFRDDLFLNYFFLLSSIISYLTFIISMNNTRSTDCFCNKWNHATLLSMHSPNWLICQQIKNISSSDLVYRNGLLMTQLSMKRLIPNHCITAYYID